MDMEKEFRLLTTLEKLHLKYTDRTKYVKYKWKARAYQSFHKRQEKIDLFLKNNKVHTPDQIIETARQKGEFNMIHSGNAGDIIYALPTIKAIRSLIKEPINLYLRLDQSHDLHPLYTHPLGNVTLNRQMAEMLIPLILEQEYIQTCSCYTNEETHLKLDLFRELPIWLDKGNIIKWYTYTTGILPITSEPWLKVKPNKAFSDKIVIARSERYRNPHINYKFLSQHKNCCFLGVDSEYIDIQKHIPNIQFIPVDDFHQMAEIIAGSKVFIGNQSFPFSIAEALKVPRILETSFDTPNVIPEGQNGYDFFLQDHFEWMVKHLVDNKS